MKLRELRELMNEHYYYWNAYGSEQHRLMYMEVQEQYRKKIIDRYNRIRKPQEAVIEVFYEQGYKWSVHVQNEQESRATGLTKAEAMKLAKELRKELNATINEQKLTRKEKAENISWLHEHSYNYMKV